MTISVGDKLPEATLMTLDQGAPAPVALQDKVKGRKVVIFALPGAFTPTCDSAHVPSFIRSYDKIKEMGVDEIICISVNDPWVLNAWGETSGAIKAGITMLADPAGAYSSSIGMSFSAEMVGFVNRSVRYAMLVDDGEVKIFQVEEGRGVCDATGGEAMLAAMNEIAAVDA